jgi:predicted lipoprotein with Yx(FWY)xxD motif
MRALSFPTVLTLLLGLAAAASGRAAHSAPPGNVAAEARTTASTQISANKDLPYPAEVALIDAPSAWTYRQNPTRLPLYYSDDDPPGKSVCFGVCNWSWIPLLAPPDAKPVGDWSIVLRTDGKQQWAFQRHPLYTHIHDTPDVALGTDAKGWHIIPQFPQPATANR